MMMNWKTCGTKRMCSNLDYYPQICLEELRNTTTNLSQCSRCPGRDSNLVFLEYMSSFIA
jgi:hypothetical protein